jgi:DNA-binding transcriptional ArsR family regulator
MNMIQIYRCLCDETRLRILHLLKQGPLCVCHFQEILQLPQVAVSKHLAYLRRTGMVEARRHEQWMIYSLPVCRTASKPSPCFATTCAVCGLWGQNATGFPRLLKLHPPQKSLPLRVTLLPIAPQENHSSPEPIDTYNKHKRTI